MRVSLIAAVVVAVVVAGCSRTAPAPVADGMAPASVPMKTAAPHPADLTIRELADAFEHKDAVAARERISDGFDGARFWTNWDEAQWQKAASSLRAAKLKSANETERVYVLRVEGADRDVRVQRLNDKWLLDYNAFQGPFPHP